MTNVPNETVVDFLTVAVLFPNKQNVAGLYLTGDRLDPSESRPGPVDCFWS